MVRPSSCDNSFNTAFNRSSKSPRYLAPANKAAMSKDKTFLPFRLSGTSPLTIRCAKPSIIAVLPTPGSPIKTGLFLVRRIKTWMTRRISSSRPMTGSSLPNAARSVRSTVYFFSDSRFDSASEAFTCSPPRTALMADSKAALAKPCALSNLPAAPLSSSKANKNISLAIKPSPRLTANLSVTLSKLFSSREIVTSPALSVLLGRLAIALTKPAFSGAKCTPACANKALLPPSSCLIKASNKCNASMVGLSLATAKLCASLSAC